MWLAEGRCMTKRSLAFEWNDQSDLLHDYCNSPLNGLERLTSDCDNMPGVNADFFGSSGRRSRRKCPQVWQFLLDILCDTETNPSLIQWEDKQRGIFRITRSQDVARRWGKARNREGKKEMTYEHFSRAMRSVLKHACAFAFLYAKYCF